MVWKRGVRKLWKQRENSWFGPSDSLSWSDHRGVMGSHDTWVFHSYNGSCYHTIWFVKDILGLCSHSLVDSLQDLFYGNPNNEENVVIFSRVWWHSNKLPQEGYDFGRGALCSWAPALVFGMYKNQLICLNPVGPGMGTILRIQYIWTFHGYGSRSWETIRRKNVFPFVPIFYSSQVS